MTQPYFDESLPRAARIVRNLLSNVPADAVRFVRDMTGRVFVVVPDSVDQATLSELQNQIAQELGPYSPGRSAGVARRSETLSPESLFEEPILVVQVDDQPAFLIERRVSGQEWVQSPGAHERHPPRVTFYSLKGGVGRTTALLLWARDLVAAGRRVLLIDLDLEAPGIAAHVLPTDERPTFGVVDWLVEDLVGRADETMVRELWIESPLAEGLMVVPAAGRRTQEHANSYIAKLARVYLDGDIDDRPVGFACRVRRLLQSLERDLQPDVVMLDSRAGLHESAAATVLHMDAEVLMFAVDMPATWEGYTYLFDHLKEVAQAAPSRSGWRERLKMVHARAEGTRDEQRRFVSRAFGLWVDTLYDELPADLDVVPDEAFSFEEGDEAAPHWPLTILRSDRFERFSPLDHLSQVGENAVRESFGSFFDGLTSRVLGTADE
jgi:MinD-like ATPase involved in chromosome partitioning or flagellar assembly